jgi:hypothetical protein
MNQPRLNFRVTVDADLQNIRVPGDWVFRTDAPPQDILDAMAAAASKQCNRSLKFVPHQVQEEVLCIDAAAGATRPSPITVDLHSPLLQSSVVDLTTNMDQIGDWIDQQIDFDFYDDTGGAASQYQFKFTAGSAEGTGQTPEEMRVDLLKSLALQTGYTFKPGMRTLTVWNLTETTPSK